MSLKKAAGLCELERYETCGLLPLCNGLRLGLGKPPAGLNLDDCYQR